MGKEQKQNEGLGKETDGKNEPLISAINFAHAGTSQRGTRLSLRCVCLCLPRVKSAPSVKSVVKVLFSVC